MYPIVDTKEKMEVQEVFGLTGGELEDRPLRFLGEKRWQSDGSGTGEWSRRWARYWYTGSPDYAPKIERRWRGDVMTIVTCELFGTLPTKIFAKGKRWRKVARFASSGEVECPWKDTDPVGDEDGPCNLCDAIGGAHGYIYLGDGWSESVYVAR